jgi:hypothetical protein
MGVKPPELGGQIFRNLHSHLVLVIFCSPKFVFCQELSSVLLNENDCSTVREFLGVAKRAHPRLKIFIYVVPNY